MAETNIMIGSYGVGQIEVDENQVRGEGFPVNPQLVIPMKLGLTARPINQQLAVTNLWCSLILDDPSNTASQVGPAVPVLSSSVFLATSPANGRIERHYVLRFSLPLNLTHCIEARRHATPNHDFVANLVFSATIVWVTGVANSISGLTGTEPMAITDNPFAALMGMGMFYTVAPFDQVQVAPLRVRVPASEWVSKVLPGLGYDRVRLIELTLPRASGGVSENVIKYLGEALAYYDAGRYRDAISRCRDARNALEKSLGADGKHPIADIVVEKPRIAKDDPRREFLFNAWSTYSILTNAGPHYWRGERLTRHDALLCLNMTAIFVEYLGGLLE